MNILIPQDKANHFVYGLVVYLVAALASACAGAALGLPALVAYSWAVGVAASAFVGGVKEVADRLANLRAAKAGLLPPHGVEFNDFVATALGGVAGAAAVLAPNVPSLLRLH